jgi:hypothetical protein
MKFEKGSKEMKEFMAKIRSNRGKKTTPQTETKQTNEMMTTIRSKRGKKSNSQTEIKKTNELTTNEKFQIVAEAILSLEDDIATLMKKVDENE